VAPGRLESEGEGGYGWGGGGGEQWRMFNKFRSSGIKKDQPGSFLIDCLLTGGVHVIKIRNV
jgi:hypothetical protein